MRADSDVRDAFRRRFGGEPGLALAPGRVNLLGEHTDYNDGFVLPAAIDLYVTLAFARNDRGLLRAYSLAHDEQLDVRLDELMPGGARSWIDYPAGVAWALRAEGFALPGLDLVVGGNLPMGAGLSSSAALALAAARAFHAVGGHPWDGIRAAELARRAEHDYVGMPSGIMDQIAVALSEPGCAMLLDCWSLARELVPLPPAWRLVVLDTGTRRALATSAYAERRRTCESAASALGLSALREASRVRLERDRTKLTEVEFRRALHVVEENDRTVAMARALREGDEASVSTLMASSHESLRDLYEVSSPALDRIVELARRQAGCIGARMTGAGFGGSGVAVVREGEVASFVREVERAYRELTGEPGRLHSCRAVGGVSLLS